MYSNRTVKLESNIDNLMNFTSHFSTNELYEQEINCLKAIHNEQISKLCKEIENSSRLIYQLKTEIDSMRISLNVKDKQLKNSMDQSFIDDLQTKNMELIKENTNLKKEFELITNKYETLFNEMQEAREYVLKMIDGLD